MPGENLPRRVWNQQTKLTYNHWLAALVKRKCLSTKPTEQNRPYKIPWPCRGLNRSVHKTLQITAKVEIFALH